MSDVRDDTNGTPSVLWRRLRDPMVFWYGKHERLVTAENLREILDDGGYTWISAGDYNDPPSRFLCGDVVRQIRDMENRTWIVSVVDQEVVGGFLLEDEMNQGELVCCFAEEEGRPGCPRDLCLNPAQWCRNR